MTRTSKATLPRPGQAAKPKPRQRREEEERLYFADQILRLQGTDFFNQLADPAIKELIDTLIRVSGGDQAHAARIIDRALVRSSKYPTVWDLQQIATDVGNCAMLALPDGCERCHGAEWIHVTRKVKDPVTGVVYEAEGEDRCSCDRGRHLRMREAERRATSPTWATEAQS